MLDETKILHHFGIVTLPETNITPENGGFQ